MTSRLARFAALLALTAGSAAAARAEPAAPTAAPPGWSIAIHGGAGVIERSGMTPEREAAYRQALQAALDAGKAVLASGGAALDAVTAVITRLEEDPKFNAGKGAVYTWDGTHELDASIMDGRTRAAGAVAGVTTVRSPITLARRVMEDGPHVMLAGTGAEEFAREKGLELVPNSWFDTPERLEALKRLKAEKLSAIDVDYKYGTVGAVALDSHGNMAAGTSTGGTTGKRWGRVGDAPVIGAGTYAENGSCAVSATGWGEYFIRVGVARTICARISMKGEAAQAAADATLADVVSLGGDGGVIVVGPNGDAVFAMSDSMYRGRATSAGVNEVAIYGNEK